MRRNLLGSLYMCVAVAVGVAPTCAAAQTLAGGYQHSVVLKSDGTVWVAGENSDGQLGDDTTTDRRTPIAVSGLTGITAVAAGRVHSLALDSTGTLRLWGDNSGGQIGDNTSTDRRVPTTSSLSNVAEIAAGEYHTVVRLTNGHVYAWGSNSSGQLGIGSTTQSRVPVLVTTGAIAIGAGHSHTLVVKSDGTVWGAGTNGNAQLGDTTTTSPRTSLVQMAGVANATAVAGGQYHSLVRLADGTLKACGRNFWGELGDGSNQQRATAVAVGTLTDVTAIAVGERHNIVRKSDGTVWVWGYNFVGQLGDGTTTNRLSPWQVTTLSSMASVAAGDGHSLATDTSGVVFTWGGNDGAQLADGTLVNRSLPVPISGAGYDWPVAMPTFSVTPGQYTSDRSVIVTVDTPGATIHYTQNGADPTESDPTISSGGTILVSTSQTLKAKAWKAGMLESAVTSAAYELKVVQPTFNPAAGTSTTPRTVTISTTTPGATIRYTIDTTEPTASSPFYTAPIDIATTTTLKAVAFKPSWTQSSTNTGIYTMNFGTLSPPVADPVVGAYTGQVTVSLTASAGATIRYTTNNTDPTTSSTIYTAPLTFGVTTTLKAKAFHSDYTQSATLTQTYTITTPTPVISLASGEYAPGTTLTITNPDPAATMRLTTNGATPTATDPIVASGSTMSVGNFTLKVRAFKANALDSAVAEATYTLSGPLTAGTLSAGANHSLAATSDGRVYAWGTNGSNQLGDGTSTQRNSPTLLPTLSGITKVAAGGSHSLAVTHDGRLYAWGSNGSGRLGDGTTTNRSTPVLITGAPANVTAIAAGDSFSLALAGGSVYAWGVGTSGQLGLGSTSSVSTPTIVPGLSNVIAIAAGDTHSLAVTSSGALYAWGSNSWGELGDASSTQRNSPTPVALTDVASVAAGRSHSLALTTTGEVWAWGEGSNGQLGLGNTSVRNTPGQIMGLSALRIEAGDYHSAAVRTDGVLVLWGNNGSGRLGDGTTTSRSSPTVIAAPVNFAVLALGDAHTMAATADGEIWTWGSGGNGELGQGTITSRGIPEAISDPGFAWRVATPTLSVAAGTYNTNQSVIVAVQTPGATIHYTLDGNEPTTSNATVASGGTVLVDRTATLKAKAFKSGMPASVTATVAYSIKVVTPTFTPSGGTFTSPTSVTITTTTSGATLRYTTDGSDPTIASPVYAAPVSIATSTTLKAIGFKDNWTSSDLRSGTFTMSFGTLAAPTADPAGGSHEGPVAVTLSAFAGATIRYTTNGNEPSTSSTIYTQPIQIWSTTTLKAKAYHSDYTMSPTFTQTYTMTTAAPTLSLAAGAYAPGTAVVITHPDPAAVICITLNGADPTTTDPIVASGTSMLLGGFTLKARAFRSSAANSAVSQASYTLTAPLGPGALDNGDSYTALATPDGLLYAWGSNSYGQIGDGTNTNRPTPRLLQTLTGVTALSAGADHTLAVTYDGRLYAWGVNYDGQVGDGTTYTSRTSPVEVVTLANVVSVAAGARHSLALTADGFVYVWGGNWSGQLGLGSMDMTSVSVPTLIPDLTGIVAIAAGTYHSLALTATGQVYAWGANDSGQLGDGTTTRRLSPTLITGVSGVTAIAVGSMHSMALIETGALYTWGSNEFRQLGVSSTPYSSEAPLLVPNLTAVRIAAGQNHSFAVRDDGVLMAWGVNDYGQLGDGTNVMKATPTVVLGPPSVAFVSGGAYHSTAATPEGDVWTWGYSGSGQLGDGTTSTRLTPQVATSFAGTWGPTAPPIPSLPSGTYGTSETVTVSVATPNATVHYTTNGDTPTEADQLLSPGGTIAIGHNTRLRLRAWSPDRGPSPIVTRDYTLQAVTPAIAPAAGLYTSAQNVTLSTTTPGATIRYTTDGSDPTETSTVYSAAFAVNTLTTVKARAFLANWMASAVATTVYTFSYGTLTTPVAAPASGTYDAGQLVTLTAGAGATIHYTLHGGTPTESSPIYTAPISIGLTGTMILKARAFALDYTASAVMTATYTVNTTPPPSSTLTTVTVAPQEGAVAVDGDRQFTATGTYGDGSVRDLTASAVWSSSTPAFATITAGGLARGIAVGTTTIQASVGSVSGTSEVAVIASRFTRTGDIITPRASLTATLLTDGRVLVAGGDRAGDQQDSSEYYDPATGKFSPGPSGIIGRSNATATRLADGRVLFIGGSRYSSEPIVLTAQLYTPGSGVSTAGGGPISPRNQHKATLLQNGKVLITGGTSETYPTAELYDPVTNTFTPTGSMLALRFGHSATLLDDGRVLIAGGRNREHVPYQTAELYDPATGTFSTAGLLTTASQGHNATRLLNGTVLITGGHNNGMTLIRAEIYDPNLGTFTWAGSMVAGRSSHDAVLLGDGTVLLANGGTQGELGADGKMAELYDPVTRRFTEVGQMRVARLSGTATLLLNGTVLMAGGPGYDATTEIYTPGFDAPIPIALGVTPKTATTTVGMVRQFTASDHLGLPRGDASWSVSDPALATVTVVDGRAHVEPLAAGVVTVTASIGSVSDSAELTIVPMNATFDVGASIWGLPPLAGFLVGQIVEASPSSDGPDFYTVNESSTEAVIRAMRLDGQEMWRVSGPPTNRNVAPDAFGGLLVTSYNTCDQEHPMVISNIDKTGRTVWNLEGQSTCTADAPQFAIRKDGSVVISAPGNTSGFPPLMIVNGLDGGVIQTPAIPPSTFVDFTGQTLSGYSRIGAPTVDTDGSAYVLYEVRDVAYPPSVNWATLKLLKIAANGMETTTQIHHTTDDENLFPGEIIPDGEGGVIVQWIEEPAPANSTLPANPLKAARVTAGGGVTQFDLPVEVEQLVKNAKGLVVHPSLVLGENGKAFVTYDKTIASFNLASGTVNWVDTPTEKVTIVSAAAGNELVAKTTSGNGTEQVVRYSESGAPAPEAWSGELVTHYRTDLWLSATDANWVNVRAASTIAPSTSVWQTPLQKNLRRAHPGFETNYGRIDLETAASPTYVFDTYMKTFAGVNAGNIAEAHFPDGPLDAKGDRVMFKLKQVLLALQPSFDVSVVRLDPANHAFAAETEPTHHPLFGWRYWRVFSLSPGVLRIETGAFDRENRHWFPPFYLKNWLAFHYFGRKDQTDMWRQYFEHIRDDLQNATVANQDLINGTWGWDYKYIMTQVCGAPPQESGFCAPIP